MTRLERIADAVECLDDARVFGSTAENYIRCAIGPPRIGSTPANDLEMAVHRARLAWRCAGDGLAHIEALEAEARLSAIEEVAPW